MATTTTAALSRRALRELGPCPKNDISASARESEVNAGVKDLDKKLVPVAASSARVCRYFGKLNVR
jgi:hypothetical protein